MDDIARFSFNDCLNRMEKAFLHLSKVPEEERYITEFIEALDECKGLLSDLAKEENQI